MPSSCSATSEKASVKDVPVTGTSSKTKTIDSWSYDKGVTGTTPKQNNEGKPLQTTQTKHGNMTTSLPTINQTRQLYGLL